MAFMPTLIDWVSRAIKSIPQAWTSYSGYLREIRERNNSFTAALNVRVAQLCFAFRRWNDIDSPRDIYRNATLEVTSFLHMMSSKEAAEKQARNAWEVRLSAKEILILMETMVSSVNAALNAISTLTLQFTPWAENELTNIFTKFENRISEETFLADRMSVVDLALYNEKNNCRTQTEFGSPSGPFQIWVWQL
ncbi:hypothetical protein R3P38DRAFT_2809053 [Favolaschia claudopus]|uniref:Uncharacterized protein n=1 Tax=Favolaschia claudopus TaxID=2862362 RepID=A0AAV9ZEW5_9AGAR